MAFWVTCPHLCLHSYLKLHFVVNTSPQKMNGRGGLLCLSAVFLFCSSKEGIQTEPSATSSKHFWHHFNSNVASSYVTRIRGELWNALKSCLRGKNLNPRKEAWGCMQAYFCSSLDILTVMRTILTFRDLKTRAIDVIYLKQYFNLKLHVLALFLYGRETLLMSLCLRCRAPPEPSCTTGTAHTCGCVT